MRKKPFMLAILLFARLSAYWLWSPGEKITDGRHVLGRKGIWLQYG